MIAARAFPLFALLMMACGTPREDAPPAAPPPTSTVVPITDTAAAYCAAIGEYIKVLRDSGNVVPDTMYIGRHGEFPDIDLPPVIAGVPARIIMPGEVEPVKDGERFMYLNIIGWFTGDSVEFQVVNFRQGMRHAPDGRDDRHLYFRWEAEHWVLALDSLRS